jgi:hypothetical protein
MTRDARREVTCPDPRDLADHQSCARESWSWWLPTDTSRGRSVLSAPDDTMAPISSLRYISPEDLVALQAWPTPKIQTDADVDAWKQMQSYSDYSFFLRWLSDAVVGHSLPWTNNDQSEVP